MSPRNHHFIILWSIWLIWFVATITFYEHFAKMLSLRINISNLTVNHECLNIWSVNFSSMLGKMWFPSSISKTFHDIYSVCAFTEKLFYLFNGLSPGGSIWHFIKIGCWHLRDSIFPSAWILLARQRSLKGWSKNCSENINNAPCLFLAIARGEKIVASTEY